MDNYEQYLPDDDEYFPGKGCTCHAWNEGECACDADWTDPEVYHLMADKEELLMALMKALTFREGTSSYEEAKKVFEKYTDI